MRYIAIRSLAGGGTDAGQEDNRWGCSHLAAQPLLAMLVHLLSATERVCFQVNVSSKCLSLLTIFACAACRCLQERRQAATEHRQLVLHRAAWS